jgi:hypothetical protein
MTISSRSWSRSFTFWNGNLAKQRKYSIIPSDHRSDDGAYST